MSFHHETTGFVIKYSESKPLVRNSRHVRKKIHLFNDISCFVTTITIRLFSFPCFVSISTIFTSALERSCGWILRFLSKLEENVIPIAVKSDYKTTVAETATAYKGTSVTRFEFHYRSSLQTSKSQGFYYKFRSSHVQLGAPSHIRSKPTLYSSTIQYCVS